MATGDAQLWQKLTLLALTGAAGTHETESGVACPRGVDMALEKVQVIAYRHAGSS